MADLLEQTKRVAVQPLHDSVRRKVEPGYEQFHDTVYQYETPNVKVDEASRKAPSIFAGTSSALSPVGSIRDVDIGKFPVRIYEPRRHSPSTVCGVTIYFHGGRNYCIVSIESGPMTDSIDARTGGWVAGDETSDAHITTKLCHG